MNFEKAKTTYRKNAVIQKQMAEVLVSNLVKNFENDFNKILEIGSGTGFLTDEIYKKIKFNEITLNDLTDNFTNHSPNFYLKGDILEVDLQNNYDLILSNAVFQWIEDFDKLFSKLHSSIKKGGICSFTYFGCQNFSQIKDITGIGLLYPNLNEIIKKQGFEILYFEEELKTLYFENIKELLHHIKLTGVKAKNLSWTKCDLINFEKKYQEKYMDNQGYELTYHPIYYILKAI